MNYQEYLKSNIWKGLRKQAIAKTPYCVLCNESKRLHVHHRRYPKKLGTEPVAWLTVLCAQCHKDHHKRMNARKNKSKKLSKNSTLKEKAQHSKASREKLHKINNSSDVIIRKKRR